MPLDDEVREALDTIFSGDSGLYRKRGWNRRSGFGTRPAILNIDLANGWTRPGYRFSCDDMDERIIPGVQRLLAAARAKRLPIVYTTTAFCSRFDMGAFPLKKPFEDLMLGSPAIEIDDRVPLEHPYAQEAAARRHRRLRAGGDRHADLHRRHHGELRQAHGRKADALGERLRALRTAVDTRGHHGELRRHGRGRVGDRVPAAIEWNLFDLDMKYCDVEPLERVLAYLADLEPFEER